MGYNSEQRKVIKAFDHVADKMNASPRVRKALYEAGLVESGLRSLNYGDRDSLGPLQQRPSMGWGSPSQVKDPYYAARQFVSRANKANKGFKGSAGALAQVVQRSAFPDRYHQRSGEAEAIIAKFGGDSTQAAEATSKPQAADPSVAQAAEAALPIDLSKPEMTFGAPTISPLVGTDPSNPQGAVNSAVLSTPPPPPVQQTNALAALVAPAALGTTESGGAKPPLDPVKDAKQITAIDKYERRADIIDSRKLPYLWGGGHGEGNAAGLRKYKGALDCSGAVSKVLGIDPRVSGAFGSWGKGGLRKKGDGVNIYYNGGHVLMGIVRNGKERLWGTSKSNPRGGAGWIDKADIGGAYLNRFKTRHI